MAILFTVSYVSLIERLVNITNTISRRQTIHHSCRHLYIARTYATVVLTLQSVEYEPNSHVAVVPQQKISFHC